MFPGDTGEDVTDMPENVREQDSEPDIGSDSEPVEEMETQGGSSGTSNWIERNCKD